MKIDIPSDWTTEGDSLTSQLMTSFQNQISTYFNMKKISQILEGVDFCYSEFLNKASKNPKTILPILFMARSLGAYRAACMLCMSGMNIETYALIRPMIEHAGIALMVANDDELASKFLKRHNSDTTQKEVRTLFHSKEIFNAVKKLDTNLGQQFEIIYQKCIDQGAHSNERSLTLGLDFKVNNNEVTIQTLYNKPDTLAHLNTIDSTISAALVGLVIYKNIYSERFMLLGLDREIEKLIDEKSVTIQRTFVAMKEAGNI